MHTPLFAVTALLLTVLSGGAEAQSASSAVLPTVPVPRAETLRLKFTPGETLYYRLVEDTTGTYTELHTKPQPIKSHVEMLLHQTVTTVRAADGAALVEVGIDSMVVTVDGELSPISDDTLAQMNHLAALIVLPSGKLEDTQANPDFNAEEVLTGEDPCHMNALAALGELPGTPVKVGDTWKSAVFLGFVGEKSTATLSLTDWAKKDDHTVAVITQAITGICNTPIAAAGHKASDLKIAGQMDGTRTVRLNVEAGTIDGLTSQSSMTLTLTSQFAKTPTRMQIQVKSDLTRTPPPKSMPLPSH